MERVPEEEGAGKIKVSDPLSVAWRTKWMALPEAASAGVRRLVASAVESAKATRSG
jgi:hypothetical protein